VRRLILCSGKIYVDLASSELRPVRPSIAICRIEQLSPFPEDDLRPVLSSYPHLEEVVWMQEEPRNMGAWEFVRLQLIRLIDGRWPLHYMGRPRSSSPAEGSAAWHTQVQESLIQEAYQMADARAEEGALARKN